MRVLHKRQTGFLRNYKDLAYFLIRPFLSSPGPLYQNEVKSSAFDMKMIFHSHANKTCFHKKGCALGLILSEGFWNSKVACSDTASVGLVAKSLAYLLHIQLGCKRTHTAFRKGPGD